MNYVFLSLFGAFQLSLVYLVFLTIKKHCRYPGSKTANILMDFKKKIMKIRWVTAEKKMISKNLQFFENLKNLEKSRKYFWTFSIENHIENRKIENFEIFKIFISNMISNRNFQKNIFEIFEIFGIFKNFRFLKTFFFRPSLNGFSRFFLKFIRMLSVFNSA